MNNKSLVMLVGCAATLALLAWFTSRPRQATSPRGQKLLGEININEIQSITISNEQQQSVIQHVDDGWVVANQQGYAADFQRIRSLLLDLDELRIGQALTADQDQRDRMGLTRQAGTRLALASRTGDTATMIIGNHRQPAQGSAAFSPGGVGRYIAREDAPEVYLVDNNLVNLAADPIRWLDRTILDIPPEEIASITVSNSVDGIIRFAADDANELQLAEPAFDFDSSQTTQLRSALRSLAFSRLAPAGITHAQAGFANGSRFTAITHSNLVINVNIGDSPGANEGRYAVFNVSVARSDHTNEPHESVAAMATMLNNKLSGWIYILPTFKSDVMASNIESLTRQPESDEPDATEPDLTTE